MSYEKLNLTNGDVFKAEHLNHIEDGISEIDSLLEIPIGLTTVTLPIAETITGYLNSTTELSYGTFNSTLKYDVSKADTGVVIVNSTDKNIIGYTAYKMIFTDADNNVLVGMSAGEKLVYGEDVEIEMPKNAYYFYLSAAISSTMTVKISYYTGTTLLSDAVTEMTTITENCIVPKSSAYVKISISDVIIGYLNSTTELSYGTFNRTLVYDISKYDSITINSTDTNIVGYSAYKMAFVASDKATVIEGLSAGSTLVYGEDVEYTPPEGATYLYLSSSGSNTILSSSVMTVKGRTITYKYPAEMFSELQSDVEELQKGQGASLKGLKISWYGTSIPRQGYPELVGQMTGATVTNEAMGSSTARRGAWYKNWSQENDPYCIKTISWACGVYGLMMSVEELEDVFANWQEYAESWGNVYEGEEGSPTNKIVNDINDGSTESENLKKTLYDLRYDVRVARHCGINHEKNTKDVDVSDIYVIDHMYNDVQPMFKDDATNFTTLPDDPYDVNHPIGAVNALIKYIYDHNPQAKICLIGHYEDKKATGKWCKTALDVVADYWNIPICPLYDLLGLNQVKINTNGYWDTEYRWHDTGFSFVVNDDDTYTTNSYLPNMIKGSTTSAAEIVKKLNIVPDNGEGISTWDKTRQQIEMPDDLHPMKPEAVTKWAKVLASWLESTYKYETWESTE